MANLFGDVVEAPTPEPVAERPPLFLVTNEDVAEVADPVAARIGKSMADAASRLNQALDVKVAPVTLDVEVPVETSAHTTTSQTTPLHKPPAKPKPLHPAVAPGKHGAKKKAPRGDHEHIFIVVVVIVAAIAWMSAATVFGTHESGPHFPPGNVP